VKLDAAGPGKWLFDNAEDGDRKRRRWTNAATYAKEGTGNVIRLNFAAGQEEDWGE